MTSNDLSPLYQNVDKLKGIGPKKASYLKNLGIKIVLDAFYILPTRVIDRTQDIDFKTKNEGIDKICNMDGDIIIEEKLIGEEFSLMSITDGQNVRHFPPIQDNKRFTRYLLNRLNDHYHLFAIKFWV